LRQNSYDQHDGNRERRNPRPYRWPAIFNLPQHSRSNRTHKRRIHHRQLFQNRLAGPQIFQQLLATGTLRQVSLHLAVIQIAFHIERN
jgi:hypothetical protein